MSATFVRNHFPDDTLLTIPDGPEAHKTALRQLAMFAFGSSIEEKTVAFSTGQRYVVEGGLLKPIPVKTPNAITTRTTLL